MKLPPQRLQSIDRFTTMGVKIVSRCLGESTRRQIRAAAGNFLYTRRIHKFTRRNFRTETFSFENLLLATHLVLDRRGNLGLASRLR